MTRDLSLIVGGIMATNVNSTERVLLGDHYYSLRDTGRILRLESLASRDEQKSLIIGKNLLEMQKKVPEGFVIVSLPVLILGIYSLLEGYTVGGPRLVDFSDSMSIPRIITNSVLVYPLQNSMDYLGGRMN